MKKLEMQNAKYMTLVYTEECCKTWSQFNSGNGQCTRERLLRQAVASCDHYATDILYVLNSLENLYGKATEVDIYFRNNGVDWAYNNPELNFREQLPTQYRKIMKLVKEKDNILVYEAYGNC